MNSVALTRPKAIIFDWDNTLVDTWPVIHESLRVTFETYGLTPWTLEEAKVRVRKSMRDSFPALFGDQWEEAGKVFYRRFGEIHMEKLEPLPGAETMLKTLSAEGVYLGVVSNKQGPYLRTEADGLDWTRFFGKLVGANDAEADKPNRAPVDLALAPSGIEAGGDVWFVGDADIDIECGQNAGCVSVLVRETAPKPGEFEEIIPKLHFQSCEALCNFVKSM